MIMTTDKGRVLTICDGQFGSTGKGLIAAAIGESSTVDIATTNASANAGHTAMWKDGCKIVCSHLPMSGVVNTDAKIYLNAGSIIDIHMLLKEIEINDVQDRLTIHPNATIIGLKHIITERADSSSATKISSTQKGVGAALSDKIMRSAKLARDCPELGEWIHHLNLNVDLKNGASVVLEVPQGFSLGYHSQFYPYCTSRQCTPAQGFADAQISPRFMGNTIMTLRTYPIRVGSIPGGFSGHWYSDQDELTWEGVGQPEERTTVTDRVRRVATFSWIQYQEALREIGPDMIFANFMNYLPERDDKKEFVAKLYTEYKKVIGMGVTPYMVFGHGPNVEDVTESWSND